MNHSFFSEIAKIAATTSEKKKKPLWRQVAENAALNAALVAGVLYYTHKIDQRTVNDAYKNFGGQAKDWARNQKTYGDHFNSAFVSSAEAAFKHMPDLKKVTTKADAKKVFRAAAALNHPDRGGNEEKMKAVNAAWDNFQKSPDFSKLAQLLIYRTA